MNKVCWALFISFRVPGRGGEQLFRPLGFCRAELPARGWRGEGGGEGRLEAWVP